MIASRLNLNNVFWITDEGVKPLSEVDRDVAEFFVKADNNAFLQLLLSNKVFLVEGATEFLLLPHFYKQITGKTIEEDGVSVISCNGISYNNYLEIAKKTNKKIAVITDNDGNQERIDAAATFNETVALQHIFLGATIDDWTWEVCLYNLNKVILDEMIEVQAGADYLFHKKSYGQVLGKMLNNKVESAYKMLLSGIAFEVPQYIKDAIEWLRK
jgi:predicted ATP-dependent endonuclease of OLD family